MTTDTKPTIPNENTLQAAIELGQDLLADIEYCRMYAEDYLKEEWPTGARPLLETLARACSVASHMVSVAIEDAEKQSPTQETID